MRHIISVLMENEPGALSRVVGLFSQRNYNIDSLTVAHTEDRSLSRLTLTTSGDNARIEQITKHLNKIVDVVKLVDLTEGAHIERELMLIKTKAVGAQRAEVKRTVDIFRGQVVDLTGNVFTIQLTGTGDKLDAFITALGDSVVLEVARTGVSGISRGEKTLALRFSFESDLNDFFHCGHIFPQFFADCFYRMQTNGFIHCNKLGVVHPCVS